jgi:m7GpppX diphosphatase
MPNVIKQTNDVTIEKTILSNNMFNKYKAKALVCDELIIKPTYNKQKKIKQLRQETYNEYLEFLSNRPIEKDQWIYNILDGLKEQDKIIYNSKSGLETELESTLHDFLIIPTYVWYGEIMDKLHLLAVPFDKSIRSLRDLTAEHIPLLNFMKEKTFEVIKERYNIPLTQIKTFVHYCPSTYHFHIHFVNILNPYNLSSVEYSHDLNSIIFNLKLCSDYYKLINLNVKQ